MADPFSIVSGALGVVGVALAVGDEARRIRSLYKRFKHAVSESHQLKRDMQMLMTLLDVVESDTEEVLRLSNSSDSTCESFVLKALELYQGSLEDLRVLVEATLQKYTTKLNTKARLKYAFQENDIANFQSRLSRGLLVLQNAQQLFHEYAMDRCAGYSLFLADLFGVIGT